MEFHQDSRNEVILPATNEKIVLLEHMLDVELPYDYKAFLLHHNNRGVPKKGMFNFIAIDGKERSENIESFYDLSDEDYHNIIDQKNSYKNRIPDSVLPIAEVAGDMVCMRLSGEDKGAIYYWDHEYESEYYRFKIKENLAKISNTFNEFLLNLEVDPDEE